MNYRENAEIPIEVYWKPADVMTRLRDLDLTTEILEQALMFGLGYAVECTLHDPASTGGFLIWSKTTRRLRDQLVPLGWTQESPENYQLTVHPSGGWAIVVAPGDERTGMPGLTPATRYERGPATRHVVNQNQYSFAVLNSEFVLPSKPLIRQTWLLLHYFDDQLGTMRAELSLPADMTKDGFVVRWQERIILPSIDLGLEGQQGIGIDSPPVPDSEEEIDIPVQKKA